MCVHAPSFRGGKRGDDWLAAMLAAALNLRHFSSKTAPSASEAQHLYCVPCQKATGGTDW